MNNWYLANTKGKISPLDQIICCFKPGTQLVDKTVGMLLLANVLQQVAHDPLKGPLGQSRLATQIGQNVRQKVVDWCCSLQHSSPL